MPIGPCTSCRSGCDLVVAAGTDFADAKDRRLDFHWSTLMVVLHWLGLSFDLVVEGLTPTIVLDASFVRTVLTTGHIR